MSKAQEGGEADGKVGAERNHKGRIAGEVSPFLVGFMSDKVFGRCFRSLFIPFEYIAFICSVCTCGTRQFFMFSLLFCCIW